MLIEYNTIYTESHLTKGQWSKEYESVKADYCCNDMLGVFFVIFSFGKENYRTPSSHVWIDKSQYGGDTEPFMKIKFCPFCGREIITKELKSIKRTRVTKTRTKTIEEQFTEHKDEEIQNAP